MSNLTRRHHILSLRLSFLCSAQNFASSKTTFTNVYFAFNGHSSTSANQVQFLSNIEYSKCVPAMHAFLVFKHINAV